jgi:hypothetical protein
MGSIDDTVIERIVHGFPAVARVLERRHMKNGGLR